MRYFKIPALSIFAAVMLFMASCGKDGEGFQKTKSGLKYKFIRSGSGTKPQPGDIMLMHIKYFSAGDSLIYDSRNIKDSFTVVLVEPTFQGGVEEGFAMMGTGDSAHFKVRADSLFTKTFLTTLPVSYQPDDEIRFHVSLQRIIPKSLNDSILMARDIEMRRREFEQIELFLKQNNMDVMPTENGAYLSISKAGSGEYPKAGDTVVVSYTGRLLDGTVFDSSVDPEKPFSFVLGRQTVIQGWEECIPLLNKGTVARMVIPSDLAYGAEDYRELKGYSTLVFDVEIIDIKAALQ
jgi:FKBP-type peptidyl-prolyl cis-trans isomerase